MKVGFVGLGRMGAGMAASLLRAGHEVTVYNRTRDKANPLVAQGAKVAEQVSDACQGDCVLTMLADDEALASVAFGSGGIIQNLPSGAVHISSSTISVALCQQLAYTHAQASRGFVAAPVFGRPDVAAAGKLFVVAAGLTADMSRVKPVLDAVGQQTFIISEEAHLASLFKLSGNFLIASVIETLGEAMALADRAGIDRNRYLEILTSTLFDTRIYKNYGALIANRKFEPAGFAAPLGQKDIRLLLSAAEALQVPMPVAGVLRDRFLTLLAHAGTQLDWSAIGYLPAVDAGAPLPIQR